MINCTHCDGEGLVNTDQLSADEYGELIAMGPAAFVAAGLIPAGSDVQVCDCCGDGEGTWYGEPGSHYSPNDPSGPNGPYAYNGGLCECN